MDTEPTTKKFVKALTADGFATARKGFVVPDPDGTSRFVDLQTGKPHENAYIVYIGRAITAEDVLQKLLDANREDGRVRNLMNSLIAELQKFKIGNVVAIEQNGGEKVTLRLVRPTPKSRPGPKLPG